MSVLIPSDGSHQIVARKTRVDRRRYFQSTGPAGLSTFVNAIGVALLATYDGRIGVTSSAGVVSNWADARGSVGFGPALTAAGTAQPSYNGSNKLTFDGVNNVMSTAAAYAGFDVSTPLAFFFIGFSAAAGNFAGVSDSSSASRILLLQNASGVYAANAGNPHTTVSSVIASDSTELLVVVSSGASAGNIDVPNRARVSSAITMPAAGANFLTLGSYFASGAGKVACTAFACGVLSRVPTAGDLTALAAYAQALGATLQ